MQEQHKHTSSCPVPTRKWMPSGLPVVLFRLILLVTTLMISSTISKKTSDHVGNKTPLVNTEGGWLSGVTETSTKGRQFNAYYSIPFAQPPVGELRFKPPVGGVRWKGVRNGSTPPPPCPQLPSKLDHSFLYGDEDCLYLNIFTSKSSMSTGASLPVLVFIHGGGYTAGRAHRHQPYAFLNEDVVLVTLQYRLGIHGFLSTEDDVLPGNLGLKDQLSALRWVSRNIEKFGGDPQRVTIFGQSAGASSVHLLVMSPRSEGLFTRAIIQSGSALCSWSLGSSFKETAAALAHIVGCHNSLNSSLSLVNCLREVESDTLVAALPNLTSPSGIPCVFGPRVDGDLLPDEPEVLATTGSYRNVDLISGHTSHDGAEMLAYILADDAESYVIENFDEIAPLTTDYREEDGDPIWLTHRVYEYYTGGPTLEPADDFVKMMTDRIIGACQATSTILHAKLSAENATDANARTYRYIFSHRGQHSVLDNYNLSIGEQWVSHSDEMYYMFPGAPDWAPLTYPADLAVRDIFTKLWTNFAATGDPTPDLSLGFTWQPTTDTQQQFLTIVPSPSMMQEPPSLRRGRVFLTSLPTRQNRLLWKVNETDPFSAGAFPDI